MMKHHVNYIEVMALRQEFIFQKTIKSVRQTSFYGYPSSVEVLGMFRSFGFTPFSIVSLNTLETPIFT